jgi:hypothetical protein
VSNTHSLDDMLAALGWRREWRGDGAAIVVNADDAVVVQPIAGRFYVLTMAGDFDTPADAVTAAYRERFGTVTPPAAPVSGVDVGAIRGRMEAATAGPWRVEKARTVLHVIAALREVVALSISPPRVPEREIRDEHVRRSWADATFIAHAPTDIAALLSELDRLTARVRELEGEPRRVRVGERVTADNVGALPVGTRIDEEDTDWTATKVGPNEWKSARGFTYTDAAAIDGFHRVIYLPPTPGASDV